MSRRSVKLRVCVSSPFSVPRSGMQSNRPVKTPWRLRGSQGLRTSAKHSSHQRRRCRSSSLMRRISCESIDSSEIRVFDANASGSPALIRSTDAMKCLLDAMLVITKQDRLCHVIHATSDPFYQTWLRQLNVMQHCKVSKSCGYARRFAQSIVRSLPSATIPSATHASSSESAFCPQFRRIYVLASNSSDFTKPLVARSPTGKTSLPIAVSTKQCHTCYLIRAIVRISQRQRKVG